MKCTLLGPIVNIIKRLDFDQAVAFSMASRAWSALAGLITLIAIGRFLSDAEQGYYYTFASVLGFQVFLELGLTYVIMQFASHERAKLRISNAGTIDGDMESKARLASLLRIALRWYILASILFVCLILPSGFLILAQNATVQIAWQIPWMLVVFLTAFTFFLSPISAIIEGCGLVASVARFRFLQSVIANIVLWGSLLASARLFSLFFYAATNLLCQIIWLALLYRHFLIDLLKSTKATFPILWKDEIWPFQWRIALSWLSGYFIVQAFTPLLFIFRGAVEAGRMGMSLSLMSVVSSTSLTWVYTKAPRFGILAARGNINELDNLFFSSLRNAIATALLTSAILLSSLALFNYFEFQLVNRVLPLTPLLFLTFSTLLAVIVSAEATYLRAFKKEPFLIISLTGGLLTFVISLSIVRTFGVSGMVIIYFLVNLFLGLGLGTFIFNRQRAMRAMGK